VRFEVGCFEDEGDTVRRRFIGQKEGGRAALWFGSPCAVEGVASGGAWRGNADRAGGGGSGEEEDDSRRLAGPEWPGGPNAIWAGTERKQKKEREMGRKDDWAEMILGCAEKKKKVFRF
jgi:hypothetical protein